jgi:hypothetical protein
MLTQEKRDLIQKQRREFAARKLAALGPEYQVGKPLPMPGRDPNNRVFLQDLPEVESKCTLAALGLKEESSSSSACEIFVASSGVDYYALLFGQGKTSHVIDRVDYKIRDKTNIIIDEVDEEVLTKSYVMSTPKSDAALSYVLDVRVAEEDTMVETMENDLVKGSWADEVASSPVLSPEIGLMMSGVVSEGFDAIYDEVARVCDSVMKNEPEVLYVTESREDRVGYFTGEESKVVYVPPDGKWSDPYFVSTLIEDPEVFCDEMQIHLKNGVSEVFSTLSVAFAEILAKNKVGLNRRGFRYASMEYGVLTLQEFTDGLGAEKFAHQPVLVRVEECVDFFEMGSCPVVIDPPSGIGVYFSRRFVLSYFKKEYVGIRGFVGPLDKFLVIDIGSRSAYTNTIRMMRVYSYAHVVGTVFGEDKRAALIASLKRSVSVKAWLMLAEMEWIFGDVVPDYRHVRYYLDKEEVEAALRQVGVKWLRD